MPIYELFCPDCNTIFSFYSRTVNTTKRPLCPRCRKRKLKRQVSLFSSVSSDADSGEGGVDDLPIDEAKMEQAMASLAGEAETLDEKDPRAAAKLMRKFTRMSGMELSDGMAEAVDRMEAGEDPEKIEAELDGILDDEDPFVLPGSKGRHHRRRAEPERDETLYEM